MKTMYKFFAIILFINTMLFPQAKCQQWNGQHQSLKLVVFADKIFAECGSCGELIPLRVDYGKKQYGVNELSSYLNSNKAPLDVHIINRNKKIKVTGGIEIKEDSLTLNQIHSINAIMNELKTKHNIKAESYFNGLRNYNYKYRKGK